MGIELKVKFGLVMCQVVFFHELLIWYLDSASQNTYNSVNFIVQTN